MITLEKIRDEIFPYGNWWFLWFYLIFWSCMSFIWWIAPNMGFATWAFMAQYQGIPIESFLAKNAFIGPWLNFFWITQQAINAISFVYVIASAASDAARMVTEKKDISLKALVFSGE